MALYHDATEILTGDLPTPIKYYNPALRASYKEVEETAANRLLELLPVHVSKCRWLPVELPVEPTKPTVCPWRTVSPAETFRWDMWAYSVRVPSGWEITT